MRDDIDRKCGYCTFTDKDPRVVINHIMQAHPEIVEAAKQIGQGNKDIV